MWSTSIGPVIDSCIRCFDLILTVTTWVNAFGSSARHIGELVEVRGAAAGHNATRYSWKAWTRDTFVDLRTGLRTEACSKTYKILLFACG